MSRFLICKWIELSFLPVIFRLFLGIENSCHAVHLFFLLLIRRRCKSRASWWGRWRRLRRRWPVVNQRRWWWFRRKRRMKFVWIVTSTNSCIWMIWWRETRTTLTTSFIRNCFAKRFTAIERRSWSHRVNRHPFSLLSRTNRQVSWYLRLSLSKITIISCLRSRNRPDDLLCSFDVSLTLSFILKRIVSFMIIMIFLVVKNNIFLLQFVVLSLIHKGFESKISSSFFIIILSKFFCHSPWFFLILNQGLPEILDFHTFVVDSMNFILLPYMIIVFMLFGFGILHQELREIYHRRWCLITLLFALLSFFFSAPVILWYPLLFWAVVQNWKAWRLQTWRLQTWRL